MQKTISIKGVGKASVSPDYVIISLTLFSKDKDYQKAMQEASARISQLTASLEAIGFEKDSLKTTSFDVDTDYDSEKDENGNTKSVFNGYEVNHHLKVGFDMEAKRLTQALSAISTCIAQPMLSIAFTVKDTAAINEKLLQAASKNAKRKAEILCAASGVELGELISIDYDWNEVRFLSDTRFMAQSSCGVDIEPDTIEVSDTASFVWEIK